ncbi:flagellar biosynthesis protein FlhF [Niallia taxi]|uniref:flagellar biosynthesis protein FlhF n=1 Tax=Niallia taxi TaxID=2499688 RepID=UPI0015F3A5A4|nr:flagellar biosynthesis protein FlhF [Niallia taxi]
MRVKRYVVDNMPEAMEQIREELGNDAIILSAKDIKVGGLFGLFKKTKLEVTAAADKEKKKTPSPPVPPVAKTTTVNQAPNSAFVAPKQTMVQEKTKDAVTPFTFNTFDGLVKETTQTAPRSKVQTEVTTVMKDIEAPTPTPVHKEESTPSFQPVSLPKQVVPAPKKESSDKEELLEEIRGMKQFIADILTEREETLPEGVQEINRLLIEQNVEKTIRSELITNTIFKLKEKSNPTKEDAKVVAEEVLRDYLRGFTFKPDGQFPKYFVLVGPTGVGKTTTIAKLAAHFILSYKKKVGLVTADTYRIGAVEQLKTYANIIKIPIEVAETKEELKEKLMVLDHCDIILVDTAGRNYLQGEYIKELAKLLPEEQEMEVNLVLSMTTKPEDMKEIIDNFSVIEIDHVILTKMDETKTYGSVLTVLTQTLKPITYLTNGQDVPDDILTVNEQVIIDMLMAEKYSGTSRV